MRIARLSARAVSRRSTAGALLLAALAGVTACGGSPTAPGVQNCVTGIGRASVSLRTGDIYRVRFTMPPGAVGDLLMTAIGLPSGPTDWQASARLYEGTKLLGAQNGLQDTFVFWKSVDSVFGTPSSPYTLISRAETVDFTSILAGTIDGRVDFTVTNRSVSLSDLDQSVAVELMRPDRGDPWTSGTRGVVTAREICQF